MGADEEGGHGWVVVGLIEPAMQNMWERGLGTRQVLNFIILRIRDDHPPHRKLAAIIAATATATSDDSKETAFNLRRQKESAASPKSTSPSRGDDEGTSHHDDDLAPVPLQTHRPNRTTTKSRQLCRRLQRLRSTPSACFTSPQSDHVFSPTQRARPLHAFCHDSMSP